MDRIAAAAQAIAAARRSRQRLAALAPDIAPRDEAEGYQVQQALRDLLAAGQGPLVGYKIGCTSSVMQRYLDIPHPCCGSLFERGVHASGVRLAASDFMQVGVECEIAVKLSRELDHSEAPFTARSVGEAIDTYLPAIEIVDDRYLHWETLGAPMLVADDFFAAACVLGVPVPRRAAPDLHDVAGRILINGAEVGSGTGADVLGHPHNALAWLANHLAAQGQSLRAGQLVLTGSLVKTVWLKAGDRVSIELGRLGTVDAEFT